MLSAQPLVHGFPGKSSSHGAFGWSSLWLVQMEGRRILVDTGPFAYIPLINARLASLGLSPADITDVLLTHLHWDHMANFTMFPTATVWVGASELSWASAQPPGTPFLSDLHVAELRSYGDRLEAVQPGREVIPGVTALDSRGHTPGHLAFCVAIQEGDMIFAGDAVKNAAELASGDVESTMDATASRASIERLRSLMRDRSARLVPGHDVPLQLTGNQVVRVVAEDVDISYVSTKEGRSDVQVHIASGAVTEEERAHHVPA